MKTLKTLGAAIVLTFVLALSAFAGDIITPPAPAPTPDPGTSVACGSSQTGDSTNPGNISTQPSEDNAFVITEVTLDLLQSALLFF